MNHFANNGKEYLKKTIMGTSKDNLIQRITELEGKLMEEQETLRVAKDDLKFCRNKNKNLEDQLKSKVTYIHETSHLYCSDGEMHIQYGDYDQENWLIYNTDQLFKDLPFIINQVIKENKKMQSYYLNNIVTELKEIDYTILQDKDVSNPKDELNGI